MTEKEKMTLWESLHECYAISQVIAHSCIYTSPDSSNTALTSSYATLLERATTVLGEAIAIVDNIKSSGVN